MGDRYCSCCSRRAPPSIRREALNIKHKTSVALAAGYLIGITPPALAQDGVKSGVKWRPNDGIYVSAGNNVAERCGDATEFVVGLREKLVGGNEWNCKVDKLSDTASGALRLNLTCNDYNLAESLDSRDPNPYDRKFRETMTLRKADENSVLIRKTLNGRFRVPEWKGVYCPKEAQRAYLDATARDRQEAERKATMKSSEPEAAKW